MSTPTTLPGGAQTALGSIGGITYIQVGSEVYARDSGGYTRWFCSARQWSATATARRIAGASERAAQERERIERAVREAHRPERRRGGRLS